VPILCFSAAGEIAFTESAVVAAIHTASLATQAIAQAAGDRVPDSQYDRTYIETFAAENEALTKILEKYVAFARGV
jgi:hypothetical protein